MSDQNISAPIQTETLARRVAAARAQNQSGPPDRLMSIKEAAEFLGTSTRMPRRFVAEKLIPVVKVGKHVRFWESDIRAYLTAQTIPARLSGGGRK